MSHLLKGILLSLPAVLLCAAPIPPRDLSFEQRLAAQEAIERVTYSHQIGATKPFEEAVPRALLEGKVRTYLKQSAALEQFWKTSVTDEMLGRELERMATGTRLPERLLELYAALGNDPFLIKECLARPVLVDRLSRNFFAFDPAIHRQVREEAEEIHRLLAEGGLDPFSEYPGRSVVDLALRKPGAGPAEEDRNHPQRIGDDHSPSRELPPEEFRKLRSRWPGAASGVSKVEEERDAFVIRVVLGETADGMRGVAYRVPKTTWEEWWRKVEGRLEDERVGPAGREGGPVPLPAIRPGPASGSRNGATDGAPGGEAWAGASCGPTDNTWDNGSLDDLPDPRQEHTAVWTGSLMLVWGGLDSNNRGLSTAGRYDPATDTWSSISTLNAPGGRGSHTAVWTGSLMVIWGGWDGNYLNTGGRYDPSSDTWTLTSTSNAPSGRARHTAVWTGGLMVIWGGSDGSGSYLEGGRYDPTQDTWTPTSTANAPSARRGHTAVWTGGLMVIWGGWDGSAYSNTGGRYDPAADTWTPTSTTNAPTGRGWHTAIWAGSLMVIWGGWDGSADVDTGGRYDPATDSWTPTSTTNAPSMRDSHTAVWTGGLMLVWGGWGGEYGDVLNTGGRYDPAADLWSSISTTNAPSSRASHTALWTGSLMVLWGGYDGSDALLTGGRYDPVTDTWTPTSTTNAPAARYGHKTVWTGNLMVVWGGAASDLGPMLNTGGRYDPAMDAWTPTSTTNAPAGRGWHTAVWTGSLMVVWGGDGDNPLIFNTGGRYDPISDTWAPTSITNAPTARSDHTAVWTGSRMVVWGGSTSYDGPAFNTGGSYDPAADSWTPTSTTSAPSSRWRHTAVWTGSRMVLWGGYTKGYGPALSTGGRYDPASDTWTPTSTANAPSARGIHTAVWTGSRMVVWGGYGASGVVNTGAQYDPISDTWTPTSMTNAPAARWIHTAVWTGSLMVVWGGVSGFSGGELNTGGRYDPAADAWTPTSTTDAPIGRHLHTAVWTGSHMIVWGGADLGTTLSSGGRYVVSEFADLDGDGTTACAGDCDDTDASIYPEAPQVCDGKNNDCGAPGWPSLAGTNEADNDGDTLSACQGDCNDADAQVWHPPVEVTSLALDGSSPTSLSWDSQGALAGPGTGYDLVSGDLSSGGVSFASGACLQSGGAPPYSDTRADPAPASGYWYLARGRNSCGAGTYGTSQRDAGIPSCP